MRQPDPSHSRSEAKVLEDVTEYGVHIVHVLEDDEEEGARFSYTVGMWHSFRQPEVIVFGLPEAVAHDLLNVAADEAGNGAELTAGSRHDGFLEGYPVRFLAVEPADYPDYVGVGQWAYGDAEFPVVQLVYPDKQGRWPWDEATAAGFRATQPVLGRREPPA